MMDKINVIGLSPEQNKKFEEAIEKKLKGSLHDRLTEALVSAKLGTIGQLHSTPEEFATAILAAPSMMGVEMEVEGITADLISENQRSAEAEADADALAETLLMASKYIDPHYHGLTYADTETDTGDLCAAIDKALDAHEARKP